MAEASGGADIEEVMLHEMAQERYLNYAMSVITARALPDVRDGLKPVQRRILYAMYQNLRLTHQAKHRKSAAVVGEVMAKLHPHGDQSIYDAMVRQAQDFSMRYPLVDGQGNFGSLDGDSAAAMRYTEARLTEIAGELLGEIRKQTVAYRPNYDGTTFEPVVLPAQVPNLLINGSTGIAVGMATNIPPHNLGEVVDALIALIDKPELENEDLVGTYIHGPDFPTGGNLLEGVEEIQKTYATGRGGFTTRATWEMEDLGPGKRQIVITSIPYTVNKSTLVEKIADFIVKGKVPQIQDVRDESSDEIRVVMELRKDASQDTAMAFLFKYTPLQTRFHTNLTCLVPTDNPNVCAPAQLDLKSMLTHFLDFRLDVVTRRTQFDLDQLEREIHKLEAFELIFNDLDRAIELIRAADGKADAAGKLMAGFGLDDVQADAILETKLYRLAKLEIKSIRADLKAKREAAGKLAALLESERKRWSLVRRELKAIRSAYGDRRRTQIVEEVREFEFSEENYIVEEHAIVLVTRGGWFKRQKSYTDISAVRVRDNDQVGWALPATTRGVVTFFTSHGSSYTMRVNDVPATTGYGEPVQAHFDFGDGEKIVGVMTNHQGLLALSQYVGGSEDGEQLGLPGASEQDAEIPQEVQMLSISEAGQGLRFSADGHMEVSTRRGRTFMKLDEGDHVLGVVPCRGTEIVSIASRGGRGLTFMARDISHYKGVAKGVKAMQLEKEDSVLDFALVTSEYEGLDVETNRGSRQIVRASLAKFALTSRGNRGRPIIRRGHLIRSHKVPVEVCFDQDDREREEE